MSGSKHRNEHTFQPGNRAGIHGRGPQRPDICTQALISQLNEIDRTTGKDKIHQLVEELIKHALGYVKTVKRKDAKGQTVSEKVEVPSDIAAIKEVFDRVQGKAPQAVAISGTLDVEHSDAESRLAHLIACETAAGNAAEDQGTAH